MFETERLKLRNYIESDWERVHLYASVPEFSKFEAWGPNSTEDTKMFIKDAMRKSKKLPQHEFEFAVILKESNELIGGCGIRKDWEFGSVANLGYAINPDYHSLGYASEAARFLISFGFSQLELAVIYATCDIRNVASYRAMEKAGMRRVGEIENHRKMKGKLRSSYCYEAIKPD